MFFQVLSHASLLVRSGNKTLLTDPWLIGSCYWRSWWNYPPVRRELFETLTPNLIYITHVHWDHFHGATLKHFPKSTQIAIPAERSTRVKRDLNSMGFKNLVELPHGGSLALDKDFRITSYQFSYWGDSAVVIEADGVKLLNANDAKFMGGPLKQILKKHKPFDFAFRSHSSANDRVCYHYTDEGRVKQEDPLIYAESFFNFMETVKPRYAVPFASNHCYLHRDVFALNDIVETPVRVQDYVISAGGFSTSELKVMVSGDSWDSAAGFNIQEHSWFTNRDAHLQNLLKDNEARLQATYAMEDRSRVRLEEVTKYFKCFLAVVPRFLKHSFKDRPIVFQANYGAGADYFKVDIYRGEMLEITKKDIHEDSLVFETSALILKKAMALNMFSHIGISKRVIYRSREQDARHLTKLTELLAAYEYEVLPLRRLFSVRTARVYVRRWREIVLYIQLSIGMLAGKSVHQLETEHLSGSRAALRQVRA